MLWQTNTSNEKPVIIKFINFKEKVNSFTKAHNKLEEIFSK